MAVVLVMLFAMFNFVVDPYSMFNMPRIDRFNGRKATAESQERLIEAYDVFPTSSKTLLFGNSRVDRGLDGRMPQWPSNERPVHNLAVGGSGL